MQQNNKHRPFLEKLRSNGYYIVLFLCVIAVGVSGFIYYRTNADTPEDATMSSVAETQQKDSQDNTDSEEPSITTATQDPESVGSEEDQQDDTNNSSEGKPAKTCTPVEGDALCDYAVDHLAYNATTQDWRTHAGVDLAAQPGSEVVAAADGTVSAVYEDDYLGQTVVLRHSGGYTSQYSNLSEDIAVAVGQEVACGEAIGTVGDSAILELNTDSHLHFAVFCDNISVDPAEFLS